jgi:hypothetical protein
MAGNLLIFIFGTYGLFGLLAPKKLMSLGSPEWRQSWTSGGLMYKTVGRTRLTSACILAFALIGFIAKLNGPV